MHFSTFILAALPAAVYGVTVFSNFDCGGLSTTSTFVGCILDSCTPFFGNHSFQNNELVISEYIQTYENDDCTSPRKPVNFTAAPRACVAAITGRPIGSYRCSLAPFSV